VKQDYEKFVKDNIDALTDFTYKMVTVPAPSLSEAARAELCMEWLRGIGAEGMYTDEMGNVIYPACKGRSGKWVIFSAHMDTVFATDVPLNIAREGDVVYCPGIGDDTANVTVMLYGAKWLAEHLPLDSEYGIMFVCTVCEEIGSRGIVKVIDDIGAENVYRFYSFDCSYEFIYPDAVNIRSKQITVTAPGGHALEAFGTPNAIEILSRILCEASDKCREYIAELGSELTTFNAGIISGGTKRNIIAEKATLDFEVRSDIKEYQEHLEAIFDETAASYRTDEVGVEICRMGKGPLWRTVDDETVRLMTEEHEEILRSFGIEPIITKACTDCRYPMSRGIPSICLGLCKAGDPHKLREYFYPDSLGDGLRIMITLIMRYLD